MLAFCHSSVSVVCLTSVSVQTQVALVIRALDCDHAQPRTGHQIWSLASQVKKSDVDHMLKVYVAKLAARRILVPSMSLL